jgi:hypothetical protein
MTAGYRANSPKGRRRIAQSARGRRKVALPFLFLFLQVFSVFSEKRSLPFCMGISKKGADYFSLSLSPVVLSFLREMFSLFSSTLSISKHNGFSNRHVKDNAQTCENGKIDGARRGEGDLKSHL